MTRTPLLRAVGPLALTILFAGCAGDGARPDAFVVRDSAGVTIVENRAPTWTEADAWVIESQPFLSLTTGRDGTDHQLSRVVSAIRLSDGTIVVADGGSRTVRWYDHTGVHLSSAGGAGGGPGEFQALNWLGAFSGDSLLAWDNQAGRISVFFDGAFVRDYRPELPAAGSSISVRASLEDGRLAVVPFAIPTADLRTGVQRPLSPLWIMFPDGRIDHELGEFPGRAVEYRPSATPGGVIRGLLPFGPTTLVDSDGHRVIVGDNAAYDLRLFDQDGNLARIIRVEGAPDAVSAEDLELELDRRLSVAPPVEEIRGGIRANFEATPVPETKPFFDRLIADSEGHVWVRREAGPSTIGARWDVIAPDGRLMGSLRTPPALEITQIGLDFVLGIWTDEYDVEDIRAFRLVRTSSTSTSVARCNAHALMVVPGIMPHGSGRACAIERPV